MDPQLIPNLAVVGYWSVAPSALETEGNQFRYSSFSGNVPETPAGVEAKRELLQLLRIQLKVADVVSASLVFRGLIWMLHQMNNVSCSE